MQIQKITPSIYINKPIKNTSKPESTPLNQYSINPINIAFEARVDKGLTRFYEANADRMPRTVKTYIENLADKTSKTPLQAQATAFIALAGATSVAAIKSAYPDEELFNELKDPSESKATRGILGAFRENKELLEVCDQSILANKENFTVWLVKKVFLEGKTLEEINKDLNREINIDFKDLYEKKEGSEEIVRPSTLKALGIKLPEFEYQQSLRYTRDGYSDFVGEKISQAQRDFYASLPIEERTARARKSVEKFENWWNSMTRDQQLDMIAEQIDELEMLKRFNSSEIGKTRKQKTVNEQEKIEKLKTSTGKVKVESTFSRDDLFKIWAGNNLRIFKENLTEYDKQKIETKREQRRIQWWSSMTPEERTDYINKLRTSAEPLRFAMIDAWNNNQDILIELSYALKKYHFEKPTETLYGTEEFNKSLSEAMSNFWASHPDFAERLGNSIKESHDKIKDAINNGNFEFLKREISQARTKREKETIEAVKNYREILSDEIYESYPQYMKDFIDAYSNSESVDTKLLPLKYIQEYYEIVKDELPQETIESWTKALKQEPLSETDKINLEKIRNMESRRTAIVSRALEATLADILYECTEAPEVYMFSHADCKMAIKQISSGRENITIYSHKLEQAFNIPIKSREIDVKQIDSLYNAYNTPLEDGSVDSIIDQFIEYNYSKIKTLKDKIDLNLYLSSYFEEYQKSLSIIFNSTSKQTPEAKSYFAKKLLNNMAADLDKDSFKLKNLTVEDFNREKQLYKIANLMRKKYSFLPIDAFNMYAYELNKVLRNASKSEINTFEEVCCIPRKISTDHSKIILMDRNAFSATHKVFTLCLEQALADLIYENCRNEEVYALQMEELLSYMEAIMLIKKFPMKEANDIPCNSLGTEIEIKLKNRIQPYQIEKRFREYYNEMVNYINECIAETKNLSNEEILYVLNPNEKKVRTDELTQMRIKNTIGNELVPI